MSFDFLSSFKDADDEELALIIIQPHNYTPEAVQAARIVLERRGYSPEEAVRRFKKNIPAEPTADELSNDLAQLSHEVNSLGLTKPEVWYYVVFTLATGMLGSNIPALIFNISRIFKGQMSPNALELVPVLQVTLAFPMVFLGAIRHRWGWILFVAAALAQLSSFLGRLTEMSSFMASSDFLLYIPLAMMLGILVYFLSPYCRKVFRLHSNDGVIAFALGLSMGFLLFLLAAQ